jgi:hypothetical protein
VRTPPEVERSAVRLSSRTPLGLAREEAAADANGTSRAHDAASVAHGGRHGGGAQQELSPLAVAAAVQSGLADVGIATAAAAAALGIDFVPLADEDYVLVLREDFAASAAGCALVAAANDARFVAALAGLTGYERVTRTANQRGASPAAGA